MDATSTPRRSRPERVVERLAELAGYTSAVAILLAVLVVCYAVLLRYFIGASTVWQTELSVYLLVYATFVGGAYGLKHGDHVSVDLVVLKLPEGVRHLVRLVAAVLGLALALVVGVLAVPWWWEAAVTGERSGTAWNPPLLLPYAILPLGMLLVGLQYLVVVADAVRWLRGRGGGEADT